MDQVELDGTRINQLALKTQCRQLQSESMFAEVFDKYEHEIEKLELEIQRLNDENIGLARRVAEVEASKPISPSAFNTSTVGCRHLTLDKMNCDWLKSQILT